MIAKAGETCGSRITLLNIRYHVFQIFFTSQYGREVLDIAAGMAKAGVTTDEIDEAVHKACVERNCYPSPLNYHKFPKSCCT